MVFSSPIFLFGFLPLVLLAYYLSPRAIKNITLLIGSLLFYAWGELFYIFVMLLSIFSNYRFGNLIYNNINSQKRRKLYVTLAIIVNLFLLFSFKYANFIVENINILLIIAKIPVINLSSIHLPLGISFFTFQALSYIIDVYRKEVPAQKSILSLALYISLFPQLIAGPIVRYHDIISQIFYRNHSVEVFSSGVQRFIYGLAKKVLIANPLAEVADSAFAISGNDLTLPLAWIGVFAYSLQIFFDFSGYSDMAIGLGRMFGFRFHENFNYPYISTSLREFWRRWHISLSSWFRDYVYITLGGSRVPIARVYMNLFIVFFLTGLWHGASWNFLIWGLFHGAFLASEHAGFSNVLKMTWKPVQHLYLIMVVSISWVFFRADTLSDAVVYLNSMFDISHLETTGFQYAQVLTYESIYAFVVGVILSVPVYPGFKRYLENISGDSTMRIALFIDAPRLAILSVLLFASVLKVASSTYNPFIYFRF